jgi:hypothetical protein
MRHIAVALIHHHHHHHHHHTITIITIITIIITTTIIIINIINPLKSTAGNRALYLLAISLDLHLLASSTFLFQSAY